MGFKRLDTAGKKTFDIQFEGQTVVAYEGDSVAIALMAGGVRSIRQTPVTGSPRAPYCLMGACFDCLVVIDGQSVQSCLITAQPDMKIAQVPVLDSNAQPDPKPDRNPD